ncbi:RraA family protein [Methanospirillum sp. J.3.6.1-F.2.7.3]|uniref:RraA family protein n=1 Tax=Methanospirillum purgamenti TaxID=2834276 RepID=A0A8E7B2H2_9EURY|nr:MULTISPECIES: RraA family protein [Methanospirillum]MDX8549481.1 RraA family protein [Methanospirillum hungatei]QVV89237.1 RraA family protein [Methanospirillum sp. J.3.6.1-F.2.7.3]
MSTTEVSDCLNKSGSIPNIKPMNSQKFAVGPVRWIYGYNESNWEVHEQLIEAKEGEIIIVELFDCNDRSVFGSLVSKYLFLYRQVSGIVVLGNLRDVHTLIKEDYPIWCYGISPVGCFNKKNSVPLNPELVEKQKNLYTGSIAVCDDSGVVIIPPNIIKADFLQKLKNIEELEDIWFDCIDRRKWNTYDTVCLKKYEHRLDD